MLLSSSHRPIPLVRRADLQVSLTSLRGEEHAVVKDPLGVRYFQLPLLQYQVLDALDGRRSLSEILSRIQQGGMTTGISAAEVLRLILDLASKRLIWSQRAGTSDSLWKQALEERWRVIGAVVSNPFFIRLPGLHPGQTLKWISRYLGWIYSPAMVATAIAIIIGTWLFLLLHVDTFLHELPTVSGLLAGDGLWSLWIVVGMLKVLHELSHGMACERFGAECQSIGLAFLFFSPCLYCDVTDAWMLEKKSHRIAISMAGVYVELLISSLALWLWWLSAPGLFHQICLQVFLAGSVVTLLFNANPLLRFDGYYVLADLLEIPNLYQRSRQTIQRIAARYLLGFRLPDDARVSGNEPLSILATYGLASMAYQVPLMLGMGLFVYGLLDPIGLAAVAWFCLLGTLMLATGRFLTWSLQMSRKQKSPGRAFVQSLVSAACCASALVGIWFCPLGSSITAPVVVEPQSVQPVYVETPGTVRNVFVREGDVVEPGTLLAELENLELDRRLVSLEGLRAAHETDFRLAQAVGDPDLMTLAKTAMESSASQIEHARAEKDRLQLRASISGTLVSAKTSWQGSRGISAEPTAESAGMLNSRLIGMRLPRRACLCEIAPGHLWQAALWVDQRSRQFLSVGQPVDVCLDAFSGTVVTGKVVALGAANEPEIPAVLSTKYGGPFVTQSGTGGEEPLEPVYHATVILDEPRLPVQTGMRGTGRFTRSAMTVGSWLTDEFHRLFVVR
ncbi:MAG: biotin/lipoyl-binding protein [Planctomycetota bacterium]